jgi:hypothetical protein
MNSINKIIAVSTIILFSSCGLPYCKKTILSDDEIVWMNPYNVGDKVLFQSSDNRFDTLLITEKKLYNPSNHFIFDLCACNWVEGDNTAHANASYSLRLLNYNKTDDSFLDGIFLIYKDNDNKKASISFSLSGLYSKDLAVYSFVNIKIKNKKIDDCIILDHRNSEIGEGQSDIAVQSYIWSKHLGLVQYVLHSGDKFEYIGHIR